MNKQRVLLVSVGTALLAVAAAILAHVTERTKTLVDYDSGAIKEVRGNVFVVLEERVVPDPVGRLAMPNGSPGLTGQPKWHVALSFRPGSTYSPQNLADDVLSDLGLLATMIRSVEPEEASKLKWNYLTTLNREGEPAAGRFLKGAFKPFTTGERVLKPPPQ